MNNILDIKKEFEEEKQRLLAALCERNPVFLGLKESELNKYNIAIPSTCPACGGSWGAIYNDIVISMDYLLKFTITKVRNDAYEEAAKHFETRAKEAEWASSTAMFLPDDSYNSTLGFIKNDFETAKVIRSLKEVKQ